MREAHTMADDGTTMTFEATDIQSELVELLTSILDRQSGDDHVAELDARPGAWDSDLYSSLVEAGVLGALLGDGQEEGMGMLGLCLCLVETGARLSRIPLAASLVCGFSLAAAGMDEQVAGIASGAMTAAPALPGRLHSVRVEDDRLRGTVGIVPNGSDVDHLLIADDDSALWLIAADSAGIVAETTGFSYDNDIALVVDVPISECKRLHGVDRTHLEPRWRTALAAVAVGACREALIRTAAYASSRKQFGKPLSAKQGVLLRAADAHIDTECMTLTTMNAASLFDAGDDAADTAALEAAWWAATAGTRVVHATQHLHGGMGADLDNHIHRFFVLVRQIGIVLGAADDLLATLGGRIVNDAREERS